MAWSNVLQLTQTEHKINQGSCVGNCTDRQITGFFFDEQERAFLPYRRKYQSTFL